jgi:hypothetical protein
VWEYVQHDGGWLFLLVYSLVLSKSEYRGSKYVWIDGPRTDLLDNFGPQRLSCADFGSAHHLARVRYSFDAGDIIDADSMSYSVVCSSINCRHNCERIRWVYPELYLDRSSSRLARSGTRALEGARGTAKVVGARSTLRGLE